MGLEQLDRVLAARADEVADGVRRRASGEIVRTHTPTGLVEFDEVFGGLELGVLSLVVGHTGDGKSVLIKQFAKAAAMAGIASLVYFVEDPKRRTADRFLADDTGIAAADIGRLNVNEGGLADLRAAAGAAKDWARRVAVQFGPVTPDQILSDAENHRTVGKAPVGLIAVDYAQALANEGNMEEMCASTARALNVLAADRNISTVFGSQVVTEVLRRGRARWERSSGDVSGYLPSLGDAMWSRRMEQYAKAVLVPFRPNRWRKELGEEAEDNVMELHAPKMSFGPGGWVSLGWDGAHSRIYSKKAA
jgi:replicative DNA helicase